MPAALIKSFAEKSNKPVAYVEELWGKAKRIVKDQYDLSEPTKEAATATREKFYKLTTGILKRMLKLNESQIDEATISGLLANLTGKSKKSNPKRGKGVGLTCHAKSCKNHDQNTTCGLPVDSISLDFNWECEQYKRGRHGKG